MTTTFERVKQRMRSGVSSDGRTTFTYSLTYLAKSDSVTELSVADVLTALGQRAGSPFGEDPSATLQDVDIDRKLTIAPHCAWDVMIVYATNAKVPENDSPDPTQHRVKRSKRFAELSKHIIKDRAGSLIVNSAGEPYPSGVPASTFPNTFVYEWARNVPTRGYHGTVNLNTFNGCSPGTLLCLISSEEVYEGAYHFWRETIEMRHDPDGWQPSMVDAGLKERIYSGASYILADCRDSQKQKFTDPQPLYSAASEAGNSAKKRGTMVPFSDRPAGCVFVEVDHFEETAFEQIGVQEFPE